MRLTKPPQLMSKLGVFMFTLSTEHEILSVSIFLRLTYEYLLFTIARVANQMHTNRSFDAMKFL